MSVPTHTLIWWLEDSREDQLVEELLECYLRYMRMKLHMKVKLENSTEQIFMTDKGEVFLYSPAKQIVEYFLDTKTFNKVKFVYPKNKESVEVMRQYFDEENLPTEFGGKAILKYDHEEFSKIMAEDDLKSAALWGCNGKLKSGTNGFSGAELAPKPAS